MKKTLLLSFATVIVCNLNAQTQSSCCSKLNVTQEFAMLGKDDAFVGSHEAPLPFNYESQNGKQITFDTKDGQKGTAFEIKAEHKTNKYVFVIHEWWGLNDYIKQEAEKLQKELGDVNVIALDLYDGKVATNATDASTYMQSVKTERAVNIINGVIAYTGKDAQIAVVGWCFGGGWSLQSALLAGKQTKACVMYYGQPEKEIAKLKTLNADVLGIFAAKDQWINAEVVATFEKDMKTAGKKLTVKTFDADHAFANPSNPHFNKQYAAEAHAMAVNFLKQRLK